MFRGHEPDSVLAPMEAPQGGENDVFLNYWGSGTREAAAASVVVATARGHWGYDGAKDGTGAHCHKKGRIRARASGPDRRRHLAEPQLRSLGSATSGLR